MCSPGTTDSVTTVRCGQWEPGILDRTAVAHWVHDRCTICQALEVLLDPELRASCRRDALKRPTVVAGTEAADTQHRQVHPPYPLRVRGLALGGDRPSSDLLEDPVRSLLVVAPADPVAQILWQPNGLPFKVDMAQLWHSS